MELSQIAMKAAPTDSASYIEQMIANEKENQKSGYLKRIEELEKERKSAILLDKVINGGDIEGYKYLSSMKLDDRANNVKKTLRDRNYQGYDKCAPKDMNTNDLNLTEVFSVINQEEVDELESIVKHLSSSNELHCPRFDLEKFRHLLGEVQSMNLTNPVETIDSEEKDVSKNRRKTLDEKFSTNRNMFVKDLNFEKKCLSASFTRNISKEEKNSDSLNSKQAITNGANIQKDAKRYCLVQPSKEHPQHANEVPPVESDIQSDEEFQDCTDEQNEQISVQWTTLKMMNEGVDQNSISKFLKDELLKIWSGSEINVLDKIDLEALNEDEKLLYFKSIRKA